MVVRGTEEKREAQENGFNALKQRNREQVDVRKVNSKVSRSKETERSIRNRGNNSDEDTQFQTRAISG